MLYFLSTMNYGLLANSTSVNSHMRINFYLQVDTIFGLAEKIIVGKIFGGKASFSFIWRYKNTFSPSSV